MKKQAAKQWSNKEYAGLATVSVVLLATYFLAMPFLLAGQYKDDALSAQNKVAEKVKTLSEQYQRPAFTKVDTTVAADKADLEATRKSLGETKDTLSTERDHITGFVKLPGMGLLSGTYRDATIASRDAKEWVGKTEQAFTAAEADLSYFEYSNQIAAKYENIGSSLQNLGGNESLETIAAETDKIADQLQTALGEIRQRPPADAVLRKSFEEENAQGEKLISQLRRLATGVRNVDLTAIQQAESEFEATSTTIDNQSNQAIIDYRTNSTLNKLIVDLKVLDRKLEDDFKKI